MAAETLFTNLGAAVADLEIAAQDRLDDAEELLKAGRNASAITMGLYALEIRLKERICRRLDLDALPKAFQIHDLAGLLLLAGLSKRINDSVNSHVLYNWTELLRWSKRLNDLRYGPEAHPDWPHSTALSLFSQLRDLPHGVLPWLLTVT